MKFRTILSFFIVLQFNQLYSQVDTLDGIIKYRKYGKNYVFSEQKMGFELYNKLNFKWNETLDYVDSFFRNHNSIILRLYDKKQRLFAVGEWSNEHGFISKVTYYDRKGKIKVITDFTHDQSP
jgi:hypothetical protein